MPSQSQAHDMSGDSRVIVGEVCKLADPATPNLEYYPQLSDVGAAYWDETNGFHDIQAELEHEYGVVMTGWHLASARGVSADGSRIAGVGLWSPPGSNLTFRVGWLFDREERPPRLTAIAHENDTVSLEWETGSSDRLYVVEAASAPGVNEWREIDTVTNYVGSVTIEVSAPGAQLFRVVGTEP